LKRGWRARSRIWGLALLLVMAGIVSLCQWGLTQNPTQPEQAAQGQATQVRTEAPAPAGSPVQEITSPPRRAEEPESTATAAPARHKYIVREGDSPWKIARAHRVPLRALLKANHLRDDGYIRPGQRLEIPSGYGKGSRQAASKLDRLIHTALGYQGVRYRYGGMSSRGFDCSGFVARVSLSQGLRLPHNSAALFREGKPVDRASLQRGDLVFFRTTRRAGVSHVGIYLGEGRFIHASSGKRRVRIDTLLEGYYARHYVGARRIVY